MDDQVAVLSVARDQVEFCDAPIVSAPRNAEAESGSSAPRREDGDKGRSGNPDEAKGADGAEVSTRSSEPRGSAGDRHEGMGGAAGDGEANGMAYNHSMVAWPSRPDAHGELTLERYEGGQGVVANSARQQPCVEQNVDHVYAGRLRRWCKGQRKGEPSWGLIYSEVHIQDVILIQPEGEQFQEGDLLAFQQGKDEDGIIIARNLRKIGPEELEHIRDVLSETVASHPSRASQVIELTPGRGQHPDSYRERHDYAGAGPAAMMPQMSHQPPYPQQQAHIMPQQQQQQLQLCAGSGLHRAPMAYGHPPHQPTPPGYLSFNSRGNPGGYQGQQPHTQVAVGQGPGPGPPQPTQPQQPPQPTQPQQQWAQSTKVLLEPPPMLECFDAKAISMALTTWQWQGPRAVKSPRLWEVSHGGTVASQVGHDWFEALQQVCAAAQQQEEEVHRQSAAAQWANDNSQWMWGQGMDGGVHPMGNDNYAGCSPLGTGPVQHNMMMGMHGGEYSSHQQQGFCLGGGGDL